MGYLLLLSYIRICLCQKAPQIRPVRRCTGHLSPKRKDMAQPACAFYYATTSCCDHSKAIAVRQSHRNKPKCVVYGADAI